MVERARALLSERPHFGTGLLGVSAVTSIPPFHLASIAAGMVAIPLWRFLVLCLIGRAVRFGLLGAVTS
jgi:membrane protein YqaA with SNARE-associated domain